MSEMTDERKRDTETLAEFMGWECSEHLTLEIRKPEHAYWEGWWPFDRHDDAQLLIDECERRGLMHKVACEIHWKYGAPEKLHDSGGPDQAFVVGLGAGLLATPKQKTMAVLVVVEQLKRKEGDS